MTAAGADAVHAATPRRRGAQHIKLLGTRPATPVLVVGAITLVAAGLRFGTLDVQSVWLDEAVTMLLVHRDFFSMLSHLPSSESAPPLYYILVWGWTKVFGPGVIGFRSFSALVGTVTVPVVYLAGRRASHRVGLWAAALATVNPMLFYDSQEARCYGLLVLLCAVAFVLWQRALDSGRTRDLAWWSALSVLALLTHYFAVFMFVPEAVVLIRRLGWRRLVVPGGAVVLVGAALVPLAIRQRSTGQSDWIQTTSLLSRLAQAPKDFLVGLYSPAEIVTAVLAGLLAIAALALLARRGAAQERRWARDAITVAVGALVLPALLAATHLQDVFNGRNVIAAWTPCCVAVAVGVGAQRARRAGTVIGGALCALSLAVLIAVEITPGYQRDNWRGVAQSLGRTTTQRIIVGPQYAVAPLEIYLPHVHAFSGSSVATGELDFVSLRTRRTGRAPQPPPVLTTAPTGFHADGIVRTESYAISRFVAPHEARVSVQALRTLARDGKAEIINSR